MGIEAGGYSKNIGDLNQEIKPVRPLQDKKR